MYRVLQPGGWVQLTEHGWYIGGPKTSAYQEEFRLLHDEIGLWWGITKALPSLLQDAGFEEIRMIERKMPLGEKWGGKIGGMVKHSQQGVQRALNRKMVESGRLGEEEIGGMWEEVEKEWEERECWSVINTYIGRKPEAKRD
jgi:hypothetical protein